MPVTFKGRAKRLDDIDLPRIGARIGVGEDEIHAVLDVEAAGSGFDSQGRVKALYEPHIAYREANKLKDKTVLNKLVKAGLAYPAWRRDYPKDSYPRIEAACAVDETIALKATSWGLGQVMGFNCIAAGYDSPQVMVTAFADDEEKHLDAMVNFIITNGLDDEIRRHDWAGFARGYNGAGYKENKYDTKLAAAFAKWAKIKDTPLTPEAAGIDRPRDAAPPVSAGAGRPPEPVKVGTELDPPPAAAGRDQLPPAVIVSDEPIAKPETAWARLTRIFHGG